MWGSDCESVETFAHGNENKNNLYAEFLPFYRDNSGPLFPFSAVNFSFESS